MYQDNKRNFNQQRSKSPFIYEQPPKFILKGNNNTNSYYMKQGRPLSAMDNTDDESNSYSNSYVQLYNQQRKTNQSSIEMIQQQKYLIQQPIQSNYYRKQDKQTNDYSQQQSVSSKLQQILQKQINNNQKYSNNQEKNRFKTQTQNTTNNSLDLSQNQPQQLSKYPQNNNSRLNVFNNKAHSVDIIPDDSYSPQIYQQIKYQANQGFIKKDKSTASKLNNQTKLSILASELPTPNMINQITFNDQGQEEQEEQEESSLKQLVSQLQNENLTLISNIKKLNLTLQESKQENKQLQNELKQCKQDFQNQYDQMSRTIDLMKDETVILNAELKQKDQIIHSLNLTICEFDQQLEFYKSSQNKSKPTIPITTTSKEIDEIKNRIIARKNTNKSAREMVQNTSYQDIAQDILDEIDSSARKDLREFKKQTRNKQSQSLHENNAENKENISSFLNHSEVEK